MIIDFRTKPLPETIPKEWIAGTGYYLRTYFLIFELDDRQVIKASLDPNQPENEPLA